MSAAGWLPGRIGLTLLALFFGLTPAAAACTGAGGDLPGSDALAHAIVRHTGDARPVRIGLGRFERRPPHSRLITLAAEQQHHND